MHELFAMYGAGQLRPHVSHVLPLDQAAAALHILTGRKSTGKVVLKVRD
ncbi:MAG: zinc-binding dehydrogenase [Pseudomonadota bacterium]|nr:zinc-binding dehydrogenase [Pseudomonadota bacterium]